MMAELRIVKRAAGRVRSATAELGEERAAFKVAVSDAHAAGASLRVIGTWAGMSHEQVRRVLERAA